MGLKANIGDRVVLSKWASKYLRDKFGIKTAVVIKVDIAHKYGLRSRARYLITFRGYEKYHITLWSYQFNTLN